MLAVNSTVISGCWGSLEVINTCRTSGPVSAGPCAPESNEIDSVPLLPAGIVSGSMVACVQPQEVVTVSMIKSAWPLFCTLTSRVITSPFTTSPKVRRLFVTEMAGLPLQALRSAVRRVTPTQKANKVNHFFMMFCQPLVLQWVGQNGRNPTEFA